MLINRGGRPNATASVNTLIEVVTFMQLPQLIDINRGGCYKMPASENRLKAHQQTQYDSRIYIHRVRVSN
jgi:hypothetical protein